MKFSRLRKDFLVAVKDRFHNLGLGILGVGHVPDGPVQGPNLGDPLVLQKVLQLAVGGWRQVLRDGDLLLVLPGGGECCSSCCGGRPT